MSQGMLNRLAFLFVVYLGTFAVACGIRGYHFAGGTGDVTHAIEPGARVVVPNKLFDPPVQHPYEDVAVVPPMRCGQERWKIKTLGDDNGNVVYTMPVWDTTIDNLLTSKAPTRAALQAADAKRFPEELHKVRVPTLIMGYKQEADSDYHIVLARPENLKQTLIAEIPAPTCVPPQYAEAFSNLRRRFIKEVGAPIARFTNLAHPLKVHATGIAFFDFLHGQTGVAANGIELHPLLDWAKD